MEFYFKSKGGKMHLYRESGIFDDDLGELEETFTGKLRTHNIFGENFELEDISGFFKRKTFFNQEYQRVKGGYREEGIWR